MNKAIVMLALSQVCCLALAQSADTQVNLEAHRAGAATYVCGGVGVDEQQAIKSEAGKYDLMLTFAENTGAYLADVDVNITSVKGDVVLSAKCDGPIMLVPHAVLTWPAGAS